MSNTKLPAAFTEMEKQRARNKARDAIRRGELVRPEACQVCGNVPPPRVDGFSAIQAHHHDYSKPLDVMWLCAKCHRAETPLPAVMGAPAFGEVNGQARLSNSDVVAAKRLRSVGWTYKRIADRLSVHKTTVMRAVKGQHWSHVQEVQQ